MVDREESFYPTSSIMEHLQRMMCVILVLSVFAICTAVSIKRPEQKGTKEVIANSPERGERSAEYPTYDPEKFIKRQHGGPLTICGRVTCSHGTEVKPCQENYTDDTCIPCPANTRMLDITKSETRVLHCTKIPSCHDWPGTVPTDEPHYCTHIQLSCRCHTEAGICGYDPCNCKKKKCRSDEVLLQNCTCQSRVTTHPSLSPTPESTSTLPPETKPNSVLPPIPGSAASNMTSPTIQKQNVSMIVKTVIVASPKNDDINWKTVGVAVAISAGVMVIIGAVIYLVHVCKRRNSRDDGYCPIRFNT